MVSKYTNTVSLIKGQRPINLTETFFFLLSFCFVSSLEESSLNFHFKVNPFKPRVLFLGRRQTVQTSLHLLPNCMCANNEGDSETCTCLR